MASRRSRAVPVRGLFCAPQAKETKPIEDQNRAEGQNEGNDMYSQAESVHLRAEIHVGTGKDGGEPAKRARSAEQGGPS